ADGGAEFHGALDGACRQLGLRHTRTKPRHAWTNGFVERLQGTILQEHWRVVFRRRYFTSRTALQRSLDAFLHFYNHDPPHHRYRLPRPTPPPPFLGAPEAQEPPPLLGEPRVNTISSLDSLVGLSLAAFPVVLKGRVALAEQLAHAPTVPLELASVLEAGLCREGQRLQLGAGSDGGPQPHDLHRTVDGALVD